jgi:hypothetical protein
VAYGDNTDDQQKAAFYYFSINFAPGDRNGVA